MSDVILELNDDDHKLFTPGYYVSQIQQALEELSLDTFLNEYYFDHKFPSETLSIEMPKGAFNLRTVYVFNGGCCNVKTSVQCHFKRGYITNGANKGYTARNKIDALDPFISPYHYDNEVYYFSLQNGNVLLSSKCIGYENVRLVYNGVITNIGDVPIIPLPFRQAIKEYVLERCYRILKGRNPKFYRPLWMDIYQSLTTPFDGTWDKALSRARSVDSKELEDYKEYFMKMNY
jgi:hypothetical protein